MHFKHRIEYISTYIGDLILLSFFLFFPLMCIMMSGLRYIREIKHKRDNRVGTHKKGLCQIDSQNTTRNGEEWIIIDLLCLGKKHPTNLYILKLYVYIPYTDFKNNEGNLCISVVQ